VINPWLLTVEDRLCFSAIHAVFVAAKLALGQSFSFLISIFLSLLHIQSCFIWGMENGQATRHCSTETYYHTIVILRIDNLLVCLLSSIFCLIFSFKLKLYT
jgi:hypothetical protein